jgi:GDP-D-mannose dehydratase
MANKQLGWKLKVGFRDVVREMMAVDLDNMWQVIILKKLLEQLL